METLKLSNDLPEVSRVCLGSWAMGGWLWGGTDDQKSIDTIKKAFSMGVNFIDTAPVYGFGRSEEVVGSAVRQIGRSNIVLATKAGLEWQKNEKVFRNSDSKRITLEIEASLRRLQTDYIDLYQIHWPDPLVRIEETATLVEKLVKTGKIRAAGVSNYSIVDMERFQKICPIVSNQPPYNLFERGIESDILLYCNKNKITTLAYGSICRGLLSGRMRPDTKFDGDDLRNNDPKFLKPRYEQYLAAVKKLGTLAHDRYGKNIMQLAVRWVLDQGQTVALWGARNPGQMNGIEGVFGWKLTKADLQAIDQILTETVLDPIGPEFMQSPLRTSSEYQGAYPV